MLFSRKKNLLQQVATNSWRTDADKEALLEQIKAQDLKPLEAIPLIWHSDAPRAKARRRHSSWPSPTLRPCAPWC
jgi:hypothetical protein